MNFQIERYPKQLNVAQDFMRKIICECSGIY